MQLQQVSSQTHVSYITEGQSWLLQQEVCLCLAVVTKRGAEKHRQDVGVRETRDGFVFLLDL